MTAVLKPRLCLDAPELQDNREDVCFTPGAAERLHVEREDICFTTLPDNRVAIRVRVTNRGRRRASETLAILQAAPLGAFVPWRPLAVLPVPALVPGEEFVLQTDARRVLPAVLGDPRRVPPQRVLTALASDDDPNARRGPVLAQALPADLTDLLGRGNAHWAGNLNVFVGGRAVERHLAQALRVYPGRMNLAMFVVGSRRDAYAFRLEGEGAEWEAALYCMNRGPSVLDLRAAAAVPQREWVQMDGVSMMLLALVPPARCPRGAVEVHVEQQSTGQEAVVEFSLDPEAAGPGCYTV
jgi:hypothetical protein